jgi:hypothetical protein
MERLQSFQNGDDAQKHAERDQFRLADEVGDPSSRK